MTDKYKKYPKPKDFVPETHFLEGDVKAGQLRCQGWSRQAGRQCRRNPTSGKKKCRLHGGNIGRGTAHPAYKHGKDITIAEYLPAKLKSTFEALAQHPDPLNSIEMMTFIKTRIFDLLGRVDIGESGRLWRQTQVVWRELKKAFDTNDVEGVAEAMPELTRLIARGVSDFATYDEIGKEVDRWGRIQRGEVQRRKAEHEMIAMSEVAMMFFQIATAFREIIDRHVEEPTTNRKIQAATQRAFDKYLQSGDEGLQ